MVMAISLIVYETFDLIRIFSFKFSVTDFDPRDDATRTYCKISCLACDRDRARQLSEWKLSVYQNVVRGLSQK